MEPAYWIIAALFLIIVVQDVVFAWAVKTLCALQKTADESHQETLRLLDAAVNSLNPKE